MLGRDDINIRIERATKKKDEQTLALWQLIAELDEIRFQLRQLVCQCGKKG